MKNLFFLFLTLGCTCATAQSINDYKYVIVENQYEFQNSANEYRLNELMEFLLQKYGFETYRNNEILPTDLNRGLCNSMQLKVEKSGILWADIDARLEDCSGNVLFKTKAARGTEKDYQKAYFSAVRESFESFERLKYKYNGGENLEQSTSIAVAIGKEVKSETITIKATDTALSNNKQTKTEELPINSDKSIAYDFEDISNTEYALKFNESNDSLKLYQYGVAVGSGRKTAAGVYLITTSSFTGVGFMENEKFVIEYDANGDLMRIILEK
ncbi:hypothetical protein [Nonlabens antarcticus]|uniref:hypothetical protein n=1 Tax=Nonlabens antarcticus TaxID=392714 RepID=UPI001890CD5D|nr:hypothetical protein [Nonlabens antarcticus]